MVPASPSSFEAGSARFGVFALILLLLSSLVSVHAADVATDDSNPLNAAVGQPVDVTFSATGFPGNASAGSWQITGSLPPGLTFAGLSAAGTVNATFPHLSGTPTAAGTYNLTVRASQSADQGGPFTNVLNYSISVSPDAAPPAFKEQPSSNTVLKGTSVTFRSRAILTTTYQWRRNGVNIPGETAATLTVTADENTAGSYSVVASGNGGTATSSTATLTVVTSSPRSVDLAVGGRLELSVSVANPGGSTYTWKRDGTAIAGATSATYVVGSVSASHAGSYTVTVSNNGIPATTAAAIVTVGGEGPPATPSRLTNMSVRASLAASQTLIVGFVTDGEKNLLVRAVGPSLGTPGLGALANSAVMSDPQVAVYNGNFSPPAHAETNTDWNVSLRPEFGRLGAFDLPTGSRDAAVLRPVFGPHSALVTGTGAGVVLVEVYDAEPTAGARLKNVSARNHVGRGADILISGFVIEGQASKTLLIRGVGPKLASLGVSGVLSDPMLTIYGATGAKVAENDNWSGSLSATFAQVGAFALDAGSKDAALLVTLSPGLYTAQLSGVNEVTGEGLIEVYEVE